MGLSATGVAFKIAQIKAAIRGSYVHSYRIFSYRDAAKQRRAARVKIERGCTGVFILAACGWDCLGLDVLETTPMSFIFNSHGYFLVNLGFRRPTNLCC